MKNTAPSGGWVFGPATDLLLAGGLAALPLHGPSLLTSGRGRGARGSPGASGP